MKKVAVEESIMPVYSPRSQYRYILERDEALLSDLALNFDKFTLNLMKKQFQAKQGGLTLEQFMLLGKEYMSNWQAEQPLHELKLTRCLFMLFNEIDIDGNGTMEWEEFTNYIIERAVSLKNIKNNLEEVKSYTPSDIRPREKIDSAISKAVFLQHLNEIAYIEDGKDRLNFMNLENGAIHTFQIQGPNCILLLSSLKKVTPPREDKRLGIMHTPIHDIEYIPGKKYSIVLTSTTDGIVRGWKYSQGSLTLSNQPDNEEEKFEHDFKVEIYSLAWDTVNEILYCGQKNGGIAIWNLKTDTEKHLAVSPSERQRKKKGTRAVVHEEETVELGHEGLVICMVPMPNLQFMASGGIDGKLILWDTINNRRKNVYEEHSHGILTLAFHEGVILLFSGGFDHKICIWNPYIQSLIHKIEAHKCAINCIRLIEHTDQFISMDSEGNVKLFDVKRFNLLAGFSLESSEEKHKFNGASMLVLKRPLRLVFSGRTIRIFDYDKNYNPSSTDDAELVSVCFNQRQVAFFTASTNKVKVWNALTGTIAKIFLNISKANICFFGFDRIQKRMLVGDRQGNCLILNAINGVLIKTLPAHRGEVLGFVSTTIGGAAAFMTVGGDSIINLHSDHSYGDSEIIRSIHVTKDSLVTCFLNMPAQKCIAVGTNLGPIGFYDCETGKLSGSSVEISETIVTSLCTVEGYPLVFATYANGKLSLLLTGPFLHKFQKILSVTNLDQSTKEAAAIQYSCFSHKRLWLYFTDDRMNIKCLTFEHVLRDLHDFRIDNFEEHKIYKKPQLHTREIPLVWTTKMHVEGVIFIALLVDQTILATASSDKRIRLWNAFTGELIDSLQQNYNRDPCTPVAFMRGKHLYKSNLVERVQKKGSPEQISEYRMHFDPFYNYNLLADEVRVPSNPNWSLKVDFSHHFQTREKQISKVLSYDPKLSTQDFYFQDKKLKVSMEPASDGRRSKLVIKHPYGIRKLEYNRSRLKIISTAAEAEGDQLWMPWVNDKQWYNSHVKNLELGLQEMKGGSTLKLPSPAQVYPSVNSISSYVELSPKQPITSSPSGGTLPADPQQSVIKISSEYKLPRIANMKEKYGFQPIKDIIESINRRKSPAEVAQNYANQKQFLNKLTYETLKRDNKRGTKKSQDSPLKKLSKEERKALASLSSAFSALSQGQGDSFLIIEETESEHKFQAA